MFVSSKKYNELASDAAEILEKYEKLIRKWNKLINRINAKGGESFLDTPRLTESEINKMIRLCHPDKHDQSAVSVEITKKLLSMRESMSE